MANFLPDLPDEVYCAAGAACACASAASTVVGMLLQKEGLTRENKAMFYLGVLIFTIVKPGAQFVALLLAPVSLMAPFASVAILLNAVIVPWCRAVELSRRTWWAGVLVAVGCMVATAVGPHNAHIWSYAELCDLAAKSCVATLILSSLTAVLAVKLAFVRAQARRQPSLRSEASASRQGLSCAAAAFVPSAASALNNVIIKVLLHGLLSGPRLSLIPVAGALAFTAFLQVWSTSIGVELYDMLVYVPVQVGEQILLTMAYGAIFFEEMPVNPAAFLACTGAIVLGVCMTQSRPADCEGYHSLEDGPHEQTPTCKNNSHHQEPQAGEVPHETLLGG